MKVIHAGSARFFMDGPEVVREYAVTDKLSCGTSTLLAGETGGTDPGHPVAHEMFYCSRGHIAVYNRDSNKYYELCEGDILLIEEAEPHRISNIGSDTAVIAWCCAPKAD